MREKTTTRWLRTEVFAQIQTKVDNIQLDTTREASFHRRAASLLAMDTWKSGYPYSDSMTAASNRRLHDSDGQARDRVRDYRAAAEGSQKIELMSLFLSVFIFCDWYFERGDIWLVQFLMGLDYLHTNYILHREVKVNISSPGLTSEEDIMICGVEMKISLSWYKQTVIRKVPSRFL
ncbi:hypothetical protein CASFOL_017999 [Castilleja foliolosa]|uniref:Uncharacterized protein n=1 Tax=Castilleja foliolosa TaxID=1961234 RepID=A0ABD3D8F7_9LAMI